MYMSLAPSVYVYKLYTYVDVFLYMYIDIKPKLIKNIYSRS